MNKRIIWINTLILHYIVINVLIDVWTNVGPAPPLADKVPDWIISTSVYSNYRFRFPKSYKEKYSYIKYTYIYQQLIYKQVTNY